MIRSILKATVCGLITYAHARTVHDEIKKPDDKRSGVTIAVSSVVTIVGTLAVVGNVVSAFNKE